MRTTAAPLFLFACLLSALPACITDPVTGETVLGMPASDQEEIAMGTEYAPTFRSQYEGPYPDPELQRYCERIVLGMAKESHRPDLPWNFTILNSSKVNAFALPGGTVCITRGLLHRLETEAQFAGVMGHEIGHVAHRHSMQGMGRSTLLGLVLAGAAVGAGQSDSEWAQVGVTLGAVGGQLLLLKYSRGQELESDLRGVEYSLNSGYDPREMAGVFEIFKELKGEDGGPPAILSSHPLDDERIKAVKREVRTAHPEVKASDGAGLTKSTPEWDRLLAKLRRDQEVYEIYDEANKEFAKAITDGNRPALEGVIAKLKDCERRLPGHALFPSGVGVVLFESDRKGQARPWFEKAVALQEDLFEPHIYLSTLAHERGDSSSLRHHAKRAGQLFPHHPRPPYLLARDHDAAGEVRKAVPLYRSVLGLASEESAEYKYSAKRLRELEKTKP